MSANNQAAGPSSSTDNFSAIFNAASEEYLRVTKKRLDTHPFATQLDACRSPEAVSDVLRTQVQAFKKFREGDEKLMTWLNPIVNIVYVFSATLGNGLGLVSCLIQIAYSNRSLRSGHQPFSPANTIFTGFGVLLGVGLF